MIKGPIAFLKLLQVRSSEVLVLLLLELRIAYRTKHAHTSKQVQTIRNSTPNNINSKKKRLLNYTTHCNDRVSVKIIKNGSKTRKLWLKQDLRAETKLNLIRRG